MANLFGSLIIILIGLVTILVAIGLIVFYIWGLWKVFTKAGQAGWKALIPFYNKWVLMVDVCDLHWGWFITFVGSYLLSGFISFIGEFLSLSLKMGNGVSYVFGVLGWLMSIITILVQVAYVYNLSKKFNKKTGWVVLTMFFEIITIPLLGFINKETYTDVTVSKASLFSALFKKN